MTLRTSRATAAFAVSALALLATGCKSKPCGSPCAPEPMAQTPCEPPPCAPAPSPCAPPPCGVPTTRPVARSNALPTPPPMSQPPVVDADSRARLETMKTAVEAKNRRLADLEAQLDSMNAKHAPVAARAGTGNPGAEDAARKLAEELKGIPGAQVMVEGTNTVVIVTDSFGSGSDKLKPNPDVRAARRATSQAMARHPEAKVSVIGHTDSAPITKSTWESNVALSRARAEAVASAMASDGVARDRMRVDGVGPNDPLVSPEKTNSDKAKNRRVEIEFAFGTPPASPSGN